MGKGLAHIRGPTSKEWEFVVLQRVDLGIIICNERPQLMKGITHQASKQIFFDNFIGVFGPSTIFVSLIMESVSTKYS